MTFASNRTRNERDHGIFTTAVTFLSGLLLLVVLGGCPQDTGEPVAPQAPQEQAAEETEQEAVPEEPEVEAFEEIEAIITSAAAGLRRAPTMDRRVDMGEGNEANWLVTLYRGDRVQVTRREEHGEEMWVWVKPVGDLEGWIKEDWITPAEDTTPATCPEEVRVFELPDPTRPHRNRTIEAGTYLLVVDAQGDFSRVNHVGQRNAWVRSRDLSTAEDEVGVSRIISRVRWMKSRDDTEGIEELFSGAKEVFPGAKLLAVLAEETTLEEETVADAE